MFQRESVPNVDHVKVALSVVALIKLKYWGWGQLGIGNISKLSNITSLFSMSFTVPSVAQTANWTIPVSFGSVIISWFPPFDVM